MKYCICCRSCVSDDYVDLCSKENNSPCELSDINNQELKRINDYKKDNPSIQKIPTFLLKEHLKD